MNTAEFGDWMNRVKTRFPPVSKFIDSMQKDERARTGKFWFDELSGFEAVDADQALTTLFNGDKRIYPTEWFQAFMRTVKLARSDRKRSFAPSFGGERTLDCRHGCSEHGIVFIVGRCPKNVAYHMLVRGGLKEGESESEVYMQLDRRFPVAVACVCGKGQNLANAGVRRLNPAVDEIPGRQSVPAAQHWSTQKDF